MSPPTKELNIVKTNSFSMKRPISNKKGVKISSSINFGADRRDSNTTQMQGQLTCPSTSPA